MKSKRKEQDQPKLDMTPMIDVVFELMIFFIVTIKQEDILSRLNANRPAPNQQQSNEAPSDRIHPERPREERKGPPRKPQVAFPDVEERHGSDTLREVVSALPSHKGA